MGTSESLLESRRIFLWKEWWPSSRDSWCPGRGICPKIYEISWRPACYLDRTSWPTARRNIYLDIRFSILFSNYFSLKGLEHIKKRMLSKMFMVLSVQGSALKWKNLFSSFIFEQTPVQKRLGVQESKQEMTEGISLYWNREKTS